MNWADVVAVILMVGIVAYASASSTHQALNGMVGHFYPTIIRGNGVGYATGMGRVAAIIGPGLTNAIPSGTLGQLCSANTLSQGKRSNKPASIIAFAPPPVSSAG